MNIISPEIAFDNYYDRTKYKIAKNLAVSTTIIFAIFCFLFRNEQTEIIYYYQFSLMLTLFSLIYILFSKNYKLIFYSLSVGATVIVIISANFGSHSLHYAGFSWTILASIVAFFGIGLKFGVFITLANVIGISYFAIFYLNDNLAILIAKSANQNLSLAIEFSSILFLTAYIMYHFVLFYNYSDNNLQKNNTILAEKNALISSQNQEKTTLIKEIHHRVKNNLQIVISLLRLQKGELKSEEAKTHFNEAINRMMVMSLIHKKLYQNEDLANIKLSAYLTDLSNDVIRVANIGLPIKLTLNSEIEKIGLKTVVPLGLLINELLSNTIKHAFKTEMPKAIDLKILLEKDNSFKLIYSDSGVWVKTCEDYISFGRGLIQTLTEQLEGSFIRQNSTYTFNLKNLDNKI